MSTPYTLVKLSESVYRIVENDRFGEQPLFYLVTGRQKCVLIDTGCNTGDLPSFLKSKFGEKLKKLTIINTHNHYDHVAANHLFGEHEIYASSFDPAFTRDKFNTMGWYAGCPIKKYTVSKWLDNLEKVALSDCDDDYLQILHSPGHSPDSMCIWYPKENRLFVGDFMYRYGSIICAAVGSNIRTYTQSADTLVKFVDQQEKLSGKTVLMSCGHVDDQLESGWLRKFANLLQKIKNGETHGSGIGLFANYSAENGQINFLVRRCMRVDSVLKPILKVFFR